MLPRSFEGAQPDRTGLVSWFITQDGLIWRNNNQSDLWFDMIILRYNNMIIIMLISLVKIDNVSAVFYSIRYRKVSKLIYSFAGFIGSGSREVGATVST